jgi:hypothetical protein
MSTLTIATKGIIGTKAAKTAARNPDKVRAGVRAFAPVARAGVKAGKPLVKRQTRKRAESAADTARAWRDVLKVYAPQTAQELGLVENCPRKRTAPRVGAGIAIGAGAAYLLDPTQGQKRREKLLRMVSQH